MIAVLLSALALAGPPPLPDHPVTGNPVQPTWSNYSYLATAKDGRWLLRCYVPLHKPRFCVLIGVRR